MSEADVRFRRDQLAQSYRKRTNFPGVLQENLLDEAFFETRAKYENVRRITPRKSRPFSPHPEQQREGEEYYRFYRQLARQQRIAMQNGEEIPDLRPPMRAPFTPLSSNVAMVQAGGVKTSQPLPSSPSSATTGVPTAERQASPPLSAIPSSPSDAGNVTVSPQRGPCPPPPASLTPPPPSSTLPAVDAPSSGAARSPSPSAVEPPSSGADRALPSTAGERVEEEPHVRAEGAAGAPVGALEHEEEPAAEEGYRTPEGSPVRAPDHAVKMLRLLDEKRNEKASEMCDWIAEFWSSPTIRSNGASSEHSSSPLREGGKGVEACDRISELEQRNATLEEENKRLRDTLREKENMPLAKTPKRKRPSAKATLPKTPGRPASTTQKTGTNSGDTLLSARPKTPGKPAAGGGTGAPSAARRRPRTPGRPLGAAAVGGESAPKRVWRPGGAVPMVEFRPFVRSNEPAPKIGRI